MPSMTFLKAQSRARQHIADKMRACGLDPNKHADRMEWSRRLWARVLEYNRNALEEQAKAKENAAASSAARFVSSFPNSTATKG